MKGFRKGFKYISQMFDEKEPEIQIGYPTDVKHVAHIGFDGPSASKPSWMNEFESSPQISNGTANCMEELKNLSILPPSPDISQGEKPKKKSRRPSTGADSPLNSPGRRSTEGSSKHSRRQTFTAGTDSPLNSPPKNSRRHRSSNNSMDSPGRDSPVNIRTTKRQLNSSLAVESPARDQPSIPRHSRGKKPKESRTKDKNSPADITDREPQESETAPAIKSYAGHLNSVLEAYE
ncbi:hypothetical protein P3X46_006312 [Hevea brasiliensis]|uniref:CRIB domain-containing protein n=1 Tax=Hevea brasiliensis TaxID=3981 RepID=A0ABQ9MTW8_HEVBR|nr:CRIB domain-containing protein RIC5 [Hevea brasiliensis]KAJ9182304.1 hypothetical protein P3X46_006312 [Hevea brasiliensis]